MGVKYFIPMLEELINILRKLCYRYKQSDFNVFWTGKIHRVNTIFKEKKKVERVDTSWLQDLFVNKDSERIENWIFGTQ